MLVFLELTSILSNIILFNVKICKVMRVDGGHGRDIGF